MVDIVVIKTTIINIKGIITKVIKEIIIIINIKKIIIQIKFTKEILKGFKTKITC